jgi:hypothetical protein
MISPRRRRAIPLIGRSFVDFLQLIEKQAAAEHARRPSIASAHVNFSTLFPALNRRRHFSIAPLVPPHQLNSARDHLQHPTRLEKAVAGDAHLVVPAGERGSLFYTRYRTDSTVEGERPALAGG